MKRSSAIVFLALCLPVVLRAQSIGVFSGPDASDCDAIIPPFTLTNLYVLAIRGPASDGGITGASFSITGAPQSSAWVLTATANPAANLTLGLPWSGGPVHIFFPSCQAGPVVLLYTLQVFNISDTGYYDLRIAEPTGFAACPGVYLCDGPAFTRVCAAGGLFYLNTTNSNVIPPDTPQPADGAINVPVDTDLSWSGGQFRCCLASTGAQQVFFGTDPNPPLVQHTNGVTTSYDPGFLATNTTYYWRVQWLMDGCGQNTTPTWSFHTESLIGVQRTAWSALKGLFR